MDLQVGYTFVLVWWVAVFLGVCQTCSNLESKRNKQGFTRYDAKIARARRYTDVHKTHVCQNCLS